MSIKKSYYKPVKPSYAIELRFKAERGDDTALLELMDRNTALAREANKRLTVLERSEHYGNRWAAKHAYRYIQEIAGDNAIRFTTDQRILQDPVDYQINIQRMSRFLSNTSSTIKGNRIIDKKILDAFRAKGIKISKEMEYEFLDFITSDEWETLKKSHVGSGVLIHDMIRIGESDDVDLETFFEEMEKVVANSKTYDIAMSDMGIPFI